MQLMLFRHGIAEPYDPALPDAERTLTQRGIERTTQAAHGLARIVDRPDTILTSPKIRAMQTAAIVGDALDVNPEICPVLAAGGAREIALMLRDRSEHRLMLVGHEPYLSQLIETLCLDQSAPCRNTIEMKKAGCALLEGPIRRDEAPDRVTLQWLLPPRVLRALA